MNAFSRPALSLRAAGGAAIAALVAVVAVGDGPNDISEDVDFETTELGYGNVAMLVDLADDLSERERADVLAELPGFALNSAYAEREGLYRAEMSADDARALASRLAGDPRIEFVEPEGVVALNEPDPIALDAAPGPSAGFPNDPLYLAQWHFDQIDVEDAWTRARGAGAVVAVIDTGVAWADSADGRYPQVRDLAGTGFVPGYDFVDDDNAPHDGHGHGTHVAGTIAQTTDNGYGVAGIAPSAKIMPLRVLDDAGRGSTADIADAIRFAADNGANVINMSLGGPMPSRVMMDAINYAHSRGVLVVAAAGNNGWSMPSYPAAYPNVLAVAATQFDRSTTFYSNYGRHIDIAAPGGNTRVDQNNDGRPDGVIQETLAPGHPESHEFALYMGTSMASPHVAGAAALVYSLGVTHPDRIEEVLRATADANVDGYDPTHYGSGLLSASAATKFTVGRLHAPRSAFGALLALLFIGIAGARRRPIAVAVAAATGAVLAGGFSIPLWGLSALGVDVSCCAELAASPLMWATGAGGAILGANALVMSAVPALALYALVGGREGRRSAGAVVGVLAGLAALLITGACLPLVDVAGIPGTGALDSLWLALNGALVAGVGAVAARRR